MEERSNGSLCGMMFYVASIAFVVLVRLEGAAIKHMSTTLFVSFLKYICVYHGKRYVVVYHTTTIPYRTVMVSLLEYLSSL